MMHARTWCGPRGWTAALALLVLLLLPATAAHAGDDVPDGVQPAYDAGLGLFKKGERADLEKALALLDERKDEALDSIDYWTLYARIWKGLKKDDAALWDGIVKERQAKAPKSTVFDLAHARVSKDAKAKRRWIDSALKRNKKDLMARTALGVLLLSEGEDDDGAEILEGVLEDEPGCVGAAMGLAELSLEEGFPDEAIEVLEDTLRERKDARLYFLVAKCHERRAKDKDREKHMGKALDAAAQALGMLPCEAHIQLYDQLLKKSGDAATAAKALKEHYAKTKHPMLAALPAESAFKAGDYEGALLGLKAAGDDLTVVKGLAVSHARLGQKEQALGVGKKILEMDSLGRLFVARMAVMLGDAAAAQKTLGSLADAEAKMIRARAHAWAGEAAPILKLGAKEIRKGSRVGEDYLTLWFQARLFEKLGAQLAPEMRKKLLHARFSAAKGILPQAWSHSADLGAVKTEGWPRRAVTYFRSSCGTHFKVDGEWFGRSFDMDSEGGMMSIYRSAGGKTKCGEREQHFQAKFNGKKKKATGNGFIEFFNDDSRNSKLGDFGPAEKAFAEACSAWLDGDSEKAETACAKALRIEPGFSRVKTFRSLARALAPDGERRADAKDATESVKPWTDDFELRRAVILLRAWAGDAGFGDEIVALSKREGGMNVRDLAGL